MLKGTETEDGSFSHPAK